MSAKSFQEKLNRDMVYEKEVTSAEEYRKAIFDSFDAIIGTIEKIDSPRPEMTFYYRGYAIRCKISTYIENDKPT